MGLPLPAPSLNSSSPLLRLLLLATHGFSGSIQQHDMQRRSRRSLSTSLAFLSQPWTRASRDELKPQRSSPCSILSSQPCPQRQETRRHPHQYLLHRFLLSHTTPRDPGRKNKQSRPPLFCNLAGQTPVKAPSPSQH